MGTDWPACAVGQRSRTVPQACRRPRTRYGMRTRMYDCTSHFRIATSSGVRERYRVCSARAVAGTAPPSAHTCAGTRQMCCKRSTARAISRVQAYAIADIDAHPGADLDADSCSDLDVRSCGSIADRACVWAHTCRVHGTRTPALACSRTRKRCGMGVLGPQAIRHGRIGARAVRDNLPQMR